MTDPKDDGVRLLALAEKYERDADLYQAGSPAYAEDCRLVAAALRSAPARCDAGSGDADQLCIALSDLDRLRKAAVEACDLLAERTLGSPARSAGHNARLLLERALKNIPVTDEAGREIALELAHCVARYMSEIIYRQRLSFKAAEFVANRPRHPGDPKP